MPFEQTASPLREGRLPGGVVPELYELELKVDPEAGAFQGAVRVRATVERPLPELVLHAVDLEIAEARVAGQPVPASRIRAHEPSETLTLQLERPLPPGPAAIELRFSGKLNDQMRGLYLSTARRGKATERYAFTQFEPTSARRMFPCFDEPALKARFRLRVSAPAGLTLVSNLPPEKREVAGAWQTVEFGETPRMSSYLLALGAGRLAPSRVRADGRAIAAWTLPEQRKQAGFSLDVARASLSRLDRYFGIPYQLPKVDLVAVPDFAAGAMENWGAVFFRDSAILVDPKLTSARARRRVAEVVAHELVHQWFGNLVTMEWWDDLWLNEAFATWLAFKVIDQWKPAWRFWLDFEARKRSALAVDALRRTRPIVAPATNSDEIEAQFDALSYEKGGGMLRMIEAYLGEIAFRKGIRGYMKRHRFSNTRAADLWKALEEASGVPIGRLASDWVSRPGYPIVSQTLVSAKDRSIELSQRRFDAHGESKEPGAWTVPVVLRYRLQGEPRTRLHRVLLESASRTVKLPGSKALAWAYPNAEETGFYRVGLDAASLSALRADGARLSEIERAGLLNHLWARARNGDAPLADFLDTLRAWRADRSRLLLEDKSGYLRRLETLVRPEDRPAFEKLLQEVFGPHWERFGWTAKRGETDEAALSRAAVFAGLALSPAEPLRRDAERRLQAYLKDPRRVEPALALPLLELGARIGGPDRFEDYRKRMGAATTPEQRDLYLAGLAEFRTPELAARLVELSLGDEVRGQDIWKPLVRLLDNAAVQDAAWTRMRGRWAEIVRKGGPRGGVRVIQGLGALGTRERLEEVRAFFADPAHQVPSGERPLAQSLEGLELTIRFRERQTQALSDWLRAL